jgi:hypothetical protein
MAVTHPFGDAPSTSAVLPTYHCLRGIFVYPKIHHSTTYSKALITYLLTIRSLEPFRPFGSMQHIIACWIQEISEGQWRYSTMFFVPTRAAGRCSNNSRWPTDFPTFHSLVTSIHELFEHTAQHISIAFCLQSSTSHHGRRMRPFYAIFSL